MDPYFDDAAIAALCDQAMSVGFDAHAYCQLPFVDQDTTARLATATDNLSAAIAAVSLERASRRLPVPEPVIAAATMRDLCERALELGEIELAAIAAPGALL